MMNKEKELMGKENGLLMRNGRKSLMEQFTKRIFNKKTFVKAEKMHRWSF